MWNWKNQGSGEKFYNMSQNWGNPTTAIAASMLINHHHHSASIFEQLQFPPYHFLE